MYGGKEGEIREEMKEAPEDERVSAPVEYLRYSPLVSASANREVPSAKAG